MTPSNLSIARKQRAGQTNRKVGWVSLPLLIGTSVIYYIHGGTAQTISLVLQLLFLPLFFVHVALSLYVFGLVRPRRTLRVFHIYLGYATFVIVMVSQTTFNIEPLHSILTALMYLTIAAHIALAIRYGVARRNTEVPRRQFTQPRDAAS